MSDDDPPSRRVAARGATAGPGRRPAGGLRVEVCDARGRAVAVPGLVRWLRRVAPRRAAGSVTIALVSDERMRVLNGRHRGVDEATDVLSFPSGALRRARQLGDIAIATGLARRQASRLGHAYQDELKILALHGLLHLVGYDHETDQGRMARLERRLRRKGGLREGLIERDGA